MFTQDGMQHLNIWDFIGGIINTRRRECIPLISSATKFHSHVTLKIWFNALLHGHDNVLLGLTPTSSGKLGVLLRSVPWVLVSNFSRPCLLYLPYVCYMRLQWCILFERCILMDIWHYHPWPSGFYYSVSHARSRINSKTLIAVEFLCAVFLTDATRLWGARGFPRHISPVEPSMAYYCLYGISLENKLWKLPFLLAFKGVFKVGSYI
jgi:hypothetical protein